MEVFCMKKNNQGLWAVFYLLVAFDALLMATLILVTAIVTAVEGPKSLSKYGAADTRVISVKEVTIR